LTGIRKHDTIRLSCGIKDDPDEITWGGRAAASQCALTRVLETVILLAERGDRVMLITIKTKNVEMTDRLKTYIERKVNRLDRFLPGLDEARVELAVQPTKSAGDSQVVQVTLRNNGAILRAEERSSDMQTAIDAVLNKMHRQLEHYRGKHWRVQNRTQAAAQSDAAMAAAEAAAEAEAEAVPEVVRVKRFETRPMTAEDAIEQMELLGHDFFIFFNLNEDAFCVVYRRRDGGYGLLIPELA
jgi:putative sigma-54 modulation protein